MLLVELKPTSRALKIDMTSSIPETQQRLRDDHPGPGLQSTPQAKGTAAVSENIGAVGLEVPDILPWIMSDVEEFQKCSIDDMLKYLLVGSSKEREGLFNEDRKTHLFEECLQKVLPICNGEAQAKDNDIKVKSCQVRENLHTYSRICEEAENKLYPLFVEAANIALLFLQELEVEDLRKDDRYPLLCFHVLGPSVLIHEHQGKRSERKPDVVVVSQPAARIAHGSQEFAYSEDNFYTNVATQRPAHRFEWRSLRTFIEFKKTKTEKSMCPPPELYTYQQYTAPTEEYLEMTAVQSDLAVSSGSNLQLSSLEPFQRSSHHKGEGKATDSNGRKRTSAHLSPSTSDTKRMRIQQKRVHNPTAQAGSYAAEMFSARVGRLHVFGLIIVGDVLYLWRYDRQGAIQCSGLNFVQDLPRFLVLLLAMQRFDNLDWGLHQHIDPTFKPRESQTMTLCSDDEKEIEITLELSDANRVTRFGLSGRATNVFSAKICAESRNLSGEDDIVVKVFWPETKRTSEPDILKKVDDIAKHNDDVKGHVPQMLWHRKFEDTSTAKIRERLGLTSKGSRVLHMIIFRRLSPIHELTGNEFLQVWWATVKCHLALWKNGVYHRDVSESNLMYRRDEGEIVGVLNDFDLASTQETGTGTERTGTILSMALALLDGVGLRGGKRHLYEHDAESFIWVLIWVTLQYGNGKPRHEDDRPLDGWLGKDATQCREKRLSFLYDDTRWALSAGEGHGQNWELAKDCIDALKDTFHRGKGPLQPLDIDLAFETLLDAPVRTYL